MKIDKKMEIGGKPLKVYDQENDGVTTLWSSNGQRNFPQMSREKKLIAEDIFGLLTFRYTWGGFGDLTLREQLENKFDSFWYNAKANRYWFQFLFPLMEGQPQLKNLVAEKLQLDFTGVSRLKVRDSASESIAKAIWEKRKMRDIYEPFKDAFFSQRGTALLPEQEGSSLEKGTIVIAMKLNEGQGASFAGVRVFSDGSSSALKSAIQKEATKLYRGFIAPHTSIFENRMRDEYMKGGYTVYDSEGYNELMAAELEAMIPTLFGGNASIRSASSGDSLRKKVIRLAHQNPELRKDLLPLLKKAKDRIADGMAKAFAKDLERVLGVPVIAQFNDAWGDEHEYLIQINLFDGRPTSFFGARGQHYQGWEVTKERASLLRRAKGAISKVMKKHPNLSNANPYTEPKRLSYKNEWGDRESWYDADDYTFFVTIYP